MWHRISRNSVYLFCRISKTGFSHFYYYFFCLFRNTLFLRVQSSSIDRKISISCWLFYCLLLPFAGDDVTGCCIRLLICWRVGAAVATLPPRCLRSPVSCVLPNGIIHPSRYSVKIKTILYGEMCTLQWLKQTPPVIMIVFCFANIKIIEVLFNEFSTLECATVWGGVALTKYGKIYTDLWRAISYNYYYSYYHNHHAGTWARAHTHTPFIRLWIKKNWKIDNESSGRAAFSTQMINVNTILFLSFLSFFLAAKFSG